MQSFAPGDYVIADNPEEGDPWPNTWKITGFTLNMFGETLVKVEDIADGNKTVFYPRELSWEDGTRPTDTI